MSSNELSVYAVGDVIPDRPNPEHLFDLALPTLKKADLLFGQLEANLSEKGEPQLYMYPMEPRKINTERVSGLVHAGFDIMSLASNHHLDRGEQGLLETIDTLNRNGIETVGVGRNIEEARKPVVMERNGVRIAFLAYCSVLPKGYEARVDKSGCAPLRVSTFYEQVDWQPGTPARIVTLANQDDLAAMLEDIRKARKIADVLVLSMHWGVHYVPAVIADYQKVAGHAAIDAGVDLILGHHAHILKGVEVYKGKVIFYSLCNFVVPSSKKASMGKSIYGLKEDPEYADYTFPFDSRKSIMARFVIRGKKIAGVSFLPLYVNGMAQPEVLSRGNTHFQEVVDYMQQITDSQGLNARYQVRGDEVLITE
ncbi:MAG: CapA family protein [Chloroflexi bacterium]|nr:CapA family protein [Chloroflexota bacterium]